MEKGRKREPMGRVIVSQAVERERLRVVVEVEEGKKKERR